MSKKKARNKALARAMRAQGLHPSGEVWVEAQRLATQGLAPKQVARLVRSTLPAEEQEALRKAPIAQAPPRKLSAQAEAVKEGKVARDAKGRLLPQGAEAPLPAWVREYIGA
jgi:hypothetical protein